MTAAGKQRKIRCTCGQVLGYRWSGGGVKPVVIDAYQDERRRLTVTCPDCGERSHLTPERKENPRVQLT